ncbi:unnamed protein product, partial [Mesorhabditis belari]|uniref:Arrestin C-terminal-like domain-containing protein n=1 Tax=Mesorhabditis belari TaxID=2138241 RepID=A0AAF3EAC3_9BILA
MVKLDEFDIELTNPEHAYFAGQEISGRVILATSEPKKINEILLEIKGRARTYWTKDRGKSRKHCAHSEPYFLEQFNTNYTHKFGAANEERILPPGHHEIPFSYTLPKSLPTSFEGEFGFVRYTIKALCERPWDFDIVAKRAFTVIGIEDINSEPKLCEPVTSSECSTAIAWCCRGAGSVTAEISLPKSGYTPGEPLSISGKVSNESSRTKTVSFRFVQTIHYKAKTFAGHEEMKVQQRVIAKIPKGDVGGHETRSLAALLPLPSLCPRLGKCRIISIAYTVELEVDQTVTASVPIVIGAIPLLSELLSHSKHRNGKARESVEQRENRLDSKDNESGAVQVTITDESGRTVDSVEADALSSELDALLSARKRVRMPSSILSELYPTLPSPYYRESSFGGVDISDEKESFQFGEKNFTPKYPFYTD